MVICESSWSTHVNELGETVVTTSVANNAPFVLELQERKRRREKKTKRDREKGEGKVLNATSDAFIAVVLFFFTQSSYKEEKLGGVKSSNTRLRAIKRFR